MPWTSHALAVSAVAFCLASGGCGWGTSFLDSEERQEEALKRARDLRAVPEQAVAAYRKILDRNPRIAVAHLDLALLLHESTKDYVEAIHHYRRYLEMRPDTQKAAMIYARIQDATRRLAGQLQGGSSTTTAVAGVALDVAVLLEENAALKLEVARLTQELESAHAKREPARVEPGQPAVEPVPAIVPAAEPRKPPQVKARTYRVRQGDTLYSIAETVYGDRTQWTRLLEANGALLRGEPRRLRANMELTVP